ncbi:MAG: trigger factor [Candidatus Paceibacterota bacterium]
MNINIKKTEDTLLEINIHFLEQDLLPYKKRVLEKLQQNFEISGFRKGKAPLELIEKNTPPVELYEKTLKEAIEEIYPNILKENQINALGFPEIQITKLVPNQEAEVIIKVNFLPDFELPNYQEIAKNKRKEKKEITVEEKEIQEALNYILDSYATFEEVNRKAKKGDLVNIDYQIFDNENLKGEDKNYSLILGEQKFLPGFEEQIEGMKKNEEKEFLLKVPESFPEKSLQNKTLKVKVKVNEVKEKKLPVLDKDFLQKLGYNSEEEFKEAIKTSLKTQKENKEKERFRALLLDSLVKESQIILPKILIDVEVERMLEELKLSLEEIYLSFDKYLEQIKKTEQDLRKDFQELAQKRVKARLLLAKIFEKENLNVSEEEINQKIEEIYLSLPEEEKKKINPLALKDYAEEVLKNEKVFEKLEQIS